MKLHYTQIQLVMQLVIMSYADKCPFQEPIKCTNDKVKASKHAQEYDIRMGSNYATKYFCVPHEGYTLPRELDLSPHGIGKNCETFQYHFQSDKLTLEKVTSKKKLTSTPEKMAAKQGHFELPHISATWELSLTAYLSHRQHESRTVFDFGDKNFGIYILYIDTLHFSNSNIVNFCASESQHISLNMGKDYKTSDKWVIGSKALDQYEFKFRKTRAGKNEKFHIQYKSITEEIIPLTNSEVPSSRRKRNTSIVPDQA